MVNPVVGHGEMTREFRIVSKREELLPVLESRPKSKIHSRAGQQDTAMKTKRVIHPERWKNCPNLARSRKTKTCQSAWVLFARAAGASNTPVRQSGVRGLHEHKTRFHYRVSGFSVQDKPYINKYDVRH